MRKLVMTTFYNGYIKTALDQQWYILILLRWLWVLWPQSGYIHPDEFFQSVEVASGNILNIETYKTWEFDPRQPIRSTIIPCFLYWPAFALLKILGEWGLFTSNTGVLTTNALITMPRIVISVLGTLLDILVYKILKRYDGFDVNSGMWMYMTSYITFVYYTRTLSNTIEAFLFVVLVYAVQSDIQRFARYDKKRPRSRLTVTTRSNFPVPDDIDYIRQPETVFISCSIAVGMFNRPTFLLYAYAPYLYWLYDGYLPETLTELLDKNRIKVVLSKIQLTIILACIPSLLCILWDSIFYYDYDYFEVIITPLNFIDYNTKGENLAQHGTHSRLTHILVNIPMLFGPIAFCVIFDMFCYFVTRGNLNTGRRSSVLDLIDTKFWLHSYLFPLMFLSIFPHQEPRFLIPLLLPLIVLYSHLVFGYKSNKVFKVLWILFNIVGASFYGILHQGQLLNSIEFIKNQVMDPKDMKSSNLIIYSHTYMPPLHLFNIESPRRWEVDDNSFLWNLNDFCQYVYYSDALTYIPSTKLSILDLKGTPVSHIEEIVNRVKAVKKKSSKIHVYVIIPSSLDLYICNKNNFKFKFIFVKQFTGHLTMEDFPTPEYFQYAKKLGFPMTMCDLSDATEMQYGLFRSLYSLNVYEVMYDD